MRLVNGQRARRPHVPHRRVFQDCPGTWQPVALLRSNRATQARAHRSMDGLSLLQREATAAFASHSRVERTRADTGANYATGGRRGFRRGNSRNADAEKSAGRANHAGRTDAAPFTRSAIATD